MKKIYTLIATLLILKSSFAQTTFTVHVSNYQFKPATVNAVVGDKIKWVWDEGIHTTTSVTIPSGAAAWDKPMDASHTSFTYTLTTAGTYNYECTFHAAFGMTGTLSVTGALPVILSSFGISPAKTNGALIAWSTATEQNTDHFEIMRSTDDKNFTKISSVSAAGNSSSIHNYSFTDDAVPSYARFVYYYLSVVDKDGKKSSSNIKMFDNINGKQKLIVSLSPNPISRPGHLMLQFNAEKEGSMHVELFNSSGKLVKEDNMSAVVGLNNGHFHVGDVPAGVYTIIFSMDNFKESYRVVVQ
ncbi:MAG TPA: plastocyanin/azurin family copper-binding protein [Parafilimonas sp.]|jgi:plastocyanin|nr:plastocyanin/azurin family copper-binding protein [Parafilimonas sp.]